MSKFVVTIDGRQFEVELPPTLSSQLRSDVSTARQYPAALVLVDGISVEIVVPEPGNPVEAAQCLIVNDRPVDTTIDPNMKWIKSAWGVHKLEIHELDTNSSPLHTGNEGNGNGRIKAPIPGLIIQVKISIGESVEVGQPMIVLEAMKMENEIRAPRSGIIKSINVSPGQGVALNQVLAEID